MSVASRPQTSIEATVRAVVGTVLRVPPSLVTPHAPFTMLGMDSLGAVELTAALEDALGISLGTSAVYEYPTVASLTLFLEEGAAEPALGRMLRDAVLPDDITPSATGGTLTRNARHVLLTGATGFLGAHLARTLLDDSDATVHCLARGGVGRVVSNLEKWGLWRGAYRNRLRVVRGDLSLPLLGLTSGDFDALAHGIDAIYHAAAAVDWVHGYDALRVSNVLGTRELLRLACRDRSTPFHFVSSLGVCYSTRGPRVVDERVDMLPAIDGLHLGYAQSKAVAESLVRAAAARGLPATIVRPALITGDAHSGRSNSHDLVTRIIAGCIRLGAAPDLDWRMDCLPVDHAARAIVRLASAHENGLSVAHLAGARARHWRECVLWMKVRGYEIELLPYREWLRVLAASNDARNALLPLRSFFLHEIATEEHRTLPELYEETTRSQADDTVTRIRLAKLGAAPAPVDMRLLGRYFADFVAQGIVPALPRAPVSEMVSEMVLDGLLPAIQASLAARHGDPSLSIRDVRIAPIDTDDSIVAEFTSWRRGATVGLFRATISLSGNSETTLVIKAKPVDADVIDVAGHVARLAGPALGETFARYRDWIGFSRGHMRELALYALDEPRLRRHTPAVFAVSRDDDAGRWIVALEDIRHDSAATWSIDRMEAALDGIAQIHSIWYQRESSLHGLEWMAPPRHVERFVEMTPLWTALASHATAHSRAWRRGELADVHRRLANDVASWAGVLAAQPRTLIHNDFNPRNAAVRNGSLCAFDWELATIDLPQRDVAEWLCFTLSPSCSPAEVLHWVDRARRALESATDSTIDPHEWRLGFRAAMAELLVDRLAMYAMVDRVRSQPFLSRVASTWLAIFSALEP